MALSSSPGSWWPSRPVLPKRPGALCRPQVIRLRLVAPSLSGPQVTLRRVPGRLQPCLWAIRLRFSVSSRASPQAASLMSLASPLVSPQGTRPKSPVSSQAVRRLLPCHELGPGRSA
ncbi:unnamed protein product [Merluccius merluccius]